MPWPAHPGAPRYRLWRHPCPCRGILRPRFSAGVRFSQPAAHWQPVGRGRRAGGRAMLRQVACGGAGRCRLISSGGGERGARSSAVPKGPNPGCNPCGFFLFAIFIVAFCRRLLQDAGRAFSATAGTGLATENARKQQPRRPLDQGLVGGCAQTRRASSRCGQAGGGRAQDRRRACRRCPAAAFRRSQRQRPPATQSRRPDGSGRRLGGASGRSSGTSREPCHWPRRSRPSASLTVAMCSRTNCRNFAHSTPSALAI